MEIQIIVSTLNSNINKLDNSLLNYKNILIINQIPNKLNGEKIVNNRTEIQTINFDDIGLSKSRNLGLKLASSELVYLTDDDIVLESSFDDIISKAFSENKDFDILAFQVAGIGKKYKEYSSKEKKINYLNSMKLSSVQLVMKLDFIKKNKLHFDERFGAGSYYKMGEENIFLIDALKLGAKIKYIPTQIASVHMGDSSWFSGFNEKYFFDRGAIYKRMFGTTVAIILSIVFCFRKRKKFKAELSLTKAFQHMLSGINSFEKE